MSQKKGSLIRRLAEERRGKDAEPAEPKTQVFSIPMTPSAPPPAATPPPVAASESAPEPVSKPDPEPVDRPMSLGAPSAAPTTPPTVPTAVFGKPEEGVEKGSSSIEAPPVSSPSKPEREKAPRLARLPGRQRARKSEHCGRHPGEAKRTAGARTWLTPEENEKLELLAMAYQVSTSTLTRDILLEGLEAHKDLIEKTRRFMDSLRRTSA